jgi:hypothetical protein
MWTYFDDLFLRPGAQQRTRRQEHFQGVVCFFAICFECVSLQGLCSTRFANHLGHPVVFKNLKSLFLKVDEKREKTFFLLTLDCVSIRFYIPRNC